jgi:hypothetical protein
MASPFGISRRRSLGLVIGFAGVVALLGIEVLLGVLVDQRTS